CIKKFKLDRNFCLADRAKVTMTAPFMRAYALLLLKICHQRGAPAMGGMSALIPIKNDPAKNAIAMAGIIADKRRDATDGYDGAWLGGNGCVPIHNLMEDAATAEISRSQVWQWIRSPKGVLDDGRKVTAELVRTLVPEELAKIKEGGFEGKFDRAAQIFEQMSTQDEFAEFLTLPLYEEI